MGKATTDSRFERLDFHHRLRQLDGLSTTARMTARTVWQSGNAFAARGISQPMATAWANVAVA